MQRATCFLLALCLAFLVGAGPSGAQSPSPTPVGAASPTPTVSPTATTNSPSPEPASAPSPTPIKTPMKGGVFALVVDAASAQVLLGLPVKTSKGEDLGHVVDIVIARDGAPLAAIIDFGGFLGVGSRKIAVDWRIVHFPSSDGLKNLVADLPLDQLREAPVFKPGEPIVIMGASAAPAPAAPPKAASQAEAKP